MVGGAEPEGPGRNLSIASSFWSSVTIPTIQQLIFSLTLKNLSRTHRYVT